MSEAEVLEQTRPKPKRKRKPRWQRMGIGGYIALGIVTFLSLFPFYWMFIVASNGTDEISKIPPTLRNIFKELESDISDGQPIDGDLTFWHEQGVVLLNRTLTCQVGESNSHLNLGWSQITDRCAQILGERGVIAILWGKNAGELEKYFAKDKRLSSLDRFSQYID